MLTDRSAEHFSAHKSEHLKIYLLLFVYRITQTQFYRFCITIIMLYFDLISKNYNTFRKTFVLEKESLKLYYTNLYPTKLLKE